MLDRIYPWGKPLRAQTAQRIRAEVAREPWQITGYFALRSEIFAAEQGTLWLSSEPSGAPTTGTKIVNRSNVLQ